jgi:hypothetical protein
MFCLEGLCFDEVHPEKKLKGDQTGIRCCELGDPRSHRACLQCIRSAATSARLRWPSGEVRSSFRQRGLRWVHRHPETKCDDVTIRSNFKI